jgi:hypothetical protein
MNHYFWQTVSFYVIVAVLVLYWLLTAPWKEDTMTEKVWICPCGLKTHNEDVWNEHIKSCPKIEKAA